MSKRKKHLTIFEKFTLIISILALIFSSGLSLLAIQKSNAANETANRSNLIAEEAKNISRDNLVFEKDKRSQEYVETIISDLYQDKDNLSVI